MLSRDQEPSKKHKANDESEQDTAAEHPEAKDIKERLAESSEAGDQDSIPVTASKEQLKDENVGEKA